jgi:hypothetical protein
MLISRRLHFLIFCRSSKYQSSFRNRTGLLLSSQFIRQIENSSRINLETRSRSSQPWWRVRRQDCFIPLQRHPPADATAKSHQLLVQAGYIRKVCDHHLTYSKIA